MESKQKYVKELFDSLVPSFNSQQILKEYRSVDKWYKLYNNIIDFREYEAYINPLGININQVFSEIKPFNKAYQYIDVLLGEELKRGDNMQVALITDKAIRHKNKELKAVYNQTIASILEKEIMLQLASFRGDEEAKQQLIQQIQQEVLPDDLNLNNYSSELEILNSKLLKYIYFKDDIPSLKNEGFQHALIADKEVVYIGYEYGAPYIRVLNPLYTYFDKSPNVKYIQDGDWAAFVDIVTVHKILELYEDELSIADKRKLEDRYLGGNKLRGPQALGQSLEEIYLTDSSIFGRNEENDLYGRSYKSSSALYNDTLLVTHFEVKLMRKIGFLYFINENGDEEKTIVDETFKHPDDADVFSYTNRFGKETKRYEWIDELGNPYSIEYMNIPDVWEATRIDTDIFVRIRRKPNQYVNPDNPFSAKLGIFGRKYNAINADSISVMGRMEPYQYLYFLTFYLFIDFMSKMDGPVKNIDLSQIDSQLGDGDSKIAMEKTIWYLKKGFNIYNSLANTLGSGMSRTAPGRTEIISATGELVNFANLLDWLERLIGYAAGISPQRASQFSSNTNVTDNQQAIAQSSHITEKYFNYHNKLWAEIMTQYLNYYRKWASNLIELENKEDHILQYILPDQTIDTLRVTPELLDNADVGLFITTAGIDYVYGEKMENLSLTFLQNDQATLVDISNIIKSRLSGASPQEIHKMLEIAQSKREQREAALQQQMQEAQAQAKMEELEKEKELIVLKAEEDRKTKVAVAERQSLFQSDLNNNQVPDVLEIEKLRLAAAKLQQEEKAMMIDAQLKEKELEIKARQQKSKTS